MNVSPLFNRVEDRRFEREQLAAHVADFEAKGGKIQRFAPGETAASIAEREAKVRKDYRRRRTAVTA